MEHSPSSGDNFVLTTHRIENLSDSIFAFSMTLLVMNFTFPSGGLLVSDRQVTEFFLKEIYKLDPYIRCGVVRSVSSTCFPGSLYSRARQPVIGQSLGFSPCPP